MAELHINYGIKRMIQAAHPDWHITGYALGDKPDEVRDE